LARPYLGHPLLTVLVFALFMNSKIFSRRGSNRPYASFEYAKESPLFDYCVSTTIRSHISAAVSRSSVLRLPASPLLRHGITAILLLTGIGLTAPHARAQATTATASRKADLQVGGYFTLIPAPDYTRDTFYGGGGYATYEFYKGIGVEFNIKHAGTSDLNIYERTYELGGTYTRRYRHVYPYVRGSYGRGVFNFPNSRANLAYNLFSVGGGADIPIATHINLRGDFEYQRWLSFPNDGLTPSPISVGAAYHF
jgi:hypothetical protein